MNNNVKKLIIDIKKIMVEKNIQQKQISNYIKENYNSSFTPQLLSQKFKTGKFTIDEIMLIVDFLGYDLNLTISEN